MFVYAVYQVGSTLKYIITYYSQYGVSPEFGESFSYVLSAVYQPFVMAILLGAAGFILNEVRALNPAYYTTKEELEAIKAAKKAAKANNQVEVVVETAEEATEEATETEEPKLEVSVEDAEAEPTVVFESVEAVDATPEEEALKEAEENL